MGPSVPQATIQATKDHGRALIPRRPRIFLVAAEQSTINEDTALKSHYLQRTPTQALGPDLQAQRALMASPPLILPAPSPPHGPDFE